MSTPTNRERFLAKEKFYHKEMPGQELRYAHFKNNYYISKADKYYCTVNRIYDEHVEVQINLLGQIIKANMLFTDLMF